MNSTFKPKAYRRKCVICKTPVVTTDMKVKWCGLEHGAEYAQQLLARKKAKDTIERRRKETRQIAERKAKLKTRSDHMKEAQQIFNTWRREYCKSIGITTCICCNEPLDWNANKVDAGHYRSVGSAPHARFIENNVWPQRKQCNQYGAGRAVDYRIGLIARIGLEAVEALEADNTPRKYTVEELIAIKQTYREKLKQLRAA